MYIEELNFLKYEQNGKVSRPEVAFLESSSKQSKNLKSESTKRTRVNISFPF